MTTGARKNLEHHKAAGDRVVTRLLRQLVASLEADSATLYMPSRDKGVWVAAFVARRSADIRSTDTRSTGTRSADKPTPGSPSFAPAPAVARAAAPRAPVLTLDEQQWPLDRAMRGEVVVVEGVAQVKPVILVPLMRHGKSRRVRASRRGAEVKRRSRSQDRRVYPNAVLAIEGVKAAVWSGGSTLSPVVQGLMETTGTALSELVTARRDRRSLKATNRVLARRMRNLPHEAETQRRVAEGLRDILVVLNSDRNLPGILDYLVTQARSLLKSDACVLYRLDRDQQSIMIEAQTGLPAALAGVSELPLDLGGPGPQSFRGFILSETPLQRSDLAERDRQATSDVTVAAEAVLAWVGTLTEYYGALLSVPLVVKNTFYGNLGLYYTPSRAFSNGEVSLAMSFASQAALAIENARLRLQAEQAAVLQERGRLARDLHDAVTQSLYSLTLLAEAARRLAAAGDMPQVKNAITRLGEIGQQALKEMRLLVYELRPLVLRREGLVRALGLRMETVERRAGVEAQLVIEGEVVLPPPLEEQVYHLIQEALNNVLKHAAATAVTVRLEHTGDRLRVEVADNGRGFDPEQPGHEGGMGLLSMRERVERLGGTFAVETGLGTGTRIVVSLELLSNRPGTREPVRRAAPDDEGADDASEDDASEDEAPEDGVDVDD